MDGEHGTALSQAMGRSLRHRGPDSSACWSDPSQGIFLAHRRLAIVDVTDAGHQPMLSKSGRYVISYNGEIYNHLGLRAELDSTVPGLCWAGHSDTETLIAAIEIWGLRRALDACVGMFAIALWDRNDKTLTLARDRFGEKPLYYGWQGSSFLFGSELKALRTHPDFIGDLNRDAIALQLQRNCIPAPHTIYTNVHKLMPGCTLTVSADRIDPTIYRYWSPQDLAQAADPADNISDCDALDLFSEHFRRAVSRQMLSDVPLGALLSGGVDSSLVAAQMQALSETPINTFTIGFSEAGFDEAPFAREIARHLGTNHHETNITARDALDVIPDLPNYYDEPFSDSSQIPTYLVSRMARENVAVALSGDGADELFGGYNRHKVVEQLWPTLDAAPHALRAIGQGVLNAIPASAYATFGAVAARLDRHPYRWGNLAYRAGKLAQVLGAKHLDDYYRVLTTHWLNPQDLVIGARSAPAGAYGGCAEGLSASASLMLRDMTQYLPDDILVKVDRAAMACSLETRTPYLDRDLAEFALQLPSHLKIRNGRGKWIMRERLAQMVPSALIDRPKMGFALPIGDWLRGPLRDWSESLLDENRLRSEGIFDPAPIRQKWAEHLSGRCDWQYLLWDVLMFQAWHEATN